MDGQKKNKEVKSVIPEQLKLDSISSDDTELSKFQDPTL